MSGRAKPMSFSLFSRSMAMDLGTANTLIIVKGKGIVINEPSVVAINKKDDSVIAVGAEAKSYLGRTPQNIAAIRPMKDGVIADFAVTKTMIREFFLKAQPMSRILRPRVVICVPSGITQVEKKAVLDAAEEAGAGRIHLIEETMAAAIGAGLDVTDKKGRLVVDIGGGTTEVAVISDSSVVCGESVRLAGDEINEAIILYLQRKHQIQIGENTAESIKIKWGSVLPAEEGPAKTLTVSGKDVKNGTPREMQLDDEELRLAIREPVNVILDVIRATIDKAPATLLDTIRKEGMHLAGGGGLLQGLDVLIAQETEIACHRTEDPLTTVVQGGGRAMEDLARYQRVLIN